MTLQLKNLEGKINSIAVSPMARTRFAFHVAWPMASGLACGLALAALQNWEHVPSLVLHNATTPGARSAFWESAWRGLLLGPIVVLVLGRIGVPGLRFRGRGVSWIAWLLPLSGLPYVLHLVLWQQHTVFMQLVAVGLAAATAVMIHRSHGSGLRQRPGQPESSQRWWLAVVVLGAVLYAGYVTYHHTIHHYSLGTHAYDLGIMENIFWNSANGDLFGSSIEREGNHLGVHTSFIFLPFFALYALFPRTETLLALQACVVGAAAVPLFLLARRWGLTNKVAALVALIFLTHPGIGGANLYDFHELAFLPVLFFSVFLFWQADRPLLFWAALLALLTVKEDMSIIVMLIGLFLLMGCQFTRGLKVVLLGVAAYVVLQKMVIPHFAGGAHSYSWYYADMISDGEGPFGLLKTVILNPLFALRYALSDQKVAYCLQMFAPLAFLPFLRARGVLLLVYGLTVSLLSSRGPLFELGFQYAFLLLGPAFVAALWALKDLSTVSRRRFLTAAAILAALNVVHHGFLYPRHHFKAGFGYVDFEYGDDDRARYEELRKLVALIPPEASVTANEELVPHVATREKVETLRYAGSNAGRAYDFFLILNDKRTKARLVADFPEVAMLRQYELVESGEFLMLLGRRSAAGAPVVHHRTQ